MRYSRVSSFVSSAGFSCGGRCADLLFFVQHGFRDERHGARSQQCLNLLRVDGAAFVVRVEYQRRASRNFEERSTIGCNQLAIIAERLKGLSFARKERNEVQPVCWLPKHHDAQPRAVVIDGQEGVYPGVQEIAEELRLMPRIGHAGPHRALDFFLGEHSGVQSPRQNEPRTRLVTLRRTDTKEVLVGM